jgi:hypothetical protein
MENLLEPALAKVLFLIKKAKLAVSAEKLQTSLIPAVVKFPIRKLQIPNSKPKIFTQQS